MDAGPEDGGEVGATAIATAEGAAGAPPVDELEQAAAAGRGPGAGMAPAGLAAGDGRLLGFYDRLRGRVLRAAGRRGGGAAKVLLLIPDIFLLLVRLAADREVPAATRALIGAVLAYFVLPTDLLPEALLGGMGYLDDVALASAVVARAFSDELAPYAARHWSGPEDLRSTLAEISAVTHRLLGRGLRRRLGDRLPGSGRSAER